MVKIILAPKKKEEKESSEYKKVLEEIKKLKDINVTKRSIKQAQKGQTSKTLLTKAKGKVRSIDPEKVLRTFGGDRLVREGRTGYFNDEYEENISWLS